MSHPGPMVAATLLAEEPASPVTYHEDVVEAGISALESRDEAAAYRLFKEATQMHPRDVRAWFWRAKTAESLDEVIDCLERAAVLEPSSSQIKVNLDSAVRRREQARTARRSSAKRATQPLAPRRPTLGQRFRGLGLEITRCLTAVAAFGIGAAWLLSAVPPEVRLSIAAAADLRVLQVPDASAVFAELPLPVLGGGYRTASALPYGLGFLAEFVGFGLLSSQGWTRGWAPVVGLASAWLWLHAGAGWPSQLVLLGCAIVASGSVLAGQPEAKPPTIAQV